MYNVRNWYWIVGSDENRVFSSSEMAYRPADDETYTAWRDAGGRPTCIASEDELADVVNAPVREDMTRVEAGTLRALRDAAIGNAAAKQRLAAAESEIAALRATLVKSPLA